MNPTPTPAEPTHSEPADHTAFYRDTLHTFIRIATTLAEIVQAQATQHPDSQTPATTRPTLAPADAALVLERLGRNVRRSILLARKLDEPVAAAKTARTPHEAAPARETRAAARRQILRTVEDCLAEAKSPKAESLHAELLDRLETPDIDEDIGTRPIPDIIYEIRCDLGLAGRDHPRRTPDDVRTLCTRAAGQPTPAGLPPFLTRPPKRTPTPPRDPDPDPDDLIASILQMERRHTKRSHRDAA